MHLDLIRRHTEIQQAAIIICGDFEEITRNRKSPCRIMAFIVDVYYMICYDMMPLSSHT